MITDAKQRPVSDIFKFDANIRYIVPKYQREYIWTKTEWEDLFDDIWENGRGHFLGSIICINRSSDAIDTQELEVVDGQQRLATLSLLYAAIYSWLKQRGDLDEDLQIDLANLQYRIVLKYEKSKLKLEPSYQQNNYQDYCVVLNSAGFKAPEFKLKNVGNRRIMKAYSYFQTRLTESGADGLPLFDTAKAKELLERVDSAQLVKIEAGSHADAFRLFESLNNRGVPLSAMDLIKNKLLAELEKRKLKTIQDSFTKWNELVEDLSESYAVQQRFLRQFYNAFKIRPEIAVKGIARATRSNLVDIFERLIETDPVGVFDDLSQKASVYNRFIDPDNEANATELSQSLHDLDRIGGATSYTLLMYLASRTPCDESGLAEITQFLVKYFVRRNLTDIPATRDLDTIFIELIELIHASKEQSSVGSLVEEYLLNSKRRAGDDLFKSKLSGKIYDDNYPVARFVLSKIEEENQTRESKVDLWALDDSGRPVFTVEHIFPQGSNIPNAWVSMIAGGDAEKAKAIQADVVHKLGNLTLSGYNSKLSNLSFAQKRDRVDQKGNFVGYRNGLYLNSSLKDRDSWTSVDIENRTDVLVAKAMSLFKIGVKP